MYLMSKNEKNNAVVMDLIDFNLWILDILFKL